MYDRRDIEAQAKPYEPTRALHPEGENLNRAILRAFVRFCGIPGTHRDTSPRQEQPPRGYLGGKLGQTSVQTKGRSNSKDKIYPTLRVGREQIGKEAGDRGR